MRSMAALPSYEELARDEIYEFELVTVPMNLSGATEIETNDKYNDKLANSFRCT